MSVVGTLREVGGSSRLVAFSSVVGGGRMFGIWRSVLSRALWCSLSCRQWTKPWMWASALTVWLVIISKAHLFAPTLMCIWLFSMDLHRFSWIFTDFCWFIWFVCECICFGMIFNALWCACMCVICFGCDFYVMLWLFGGGCGDLSAYDWLVMDVFVRLWLFGNNQLWFVRLWLICNISDYVPPMIDW